MTFAFLILKESKPELPLIVPNTIFFVKWSYVPKY